MTGMLFRNDVIKGQYIFHQANVHNDSLMEMKKAYRDNSISFSNLQFLSPEQKKKMARYLHIIASGEFEITMKS